METNRFIQFRCIVETGNLRKASELLGMSHGALSKSMKVLEDQLMLTLISPEGRGIKITDDGYRVYERSKQILDQIDDLTSVKPDSTKLQPTRLATFEVFSTYFISQLLKSAPAISALELHELLPGHLEQAVQTKRVDYGITYEPIPTRGLDFMKVATVKMGVFGKQADLPFAAPVMPIRGGLSGAKGLDGWPDHAFPRKVRFQVEMMESALELARDGHCCVFIPQFIARLHNARCLKEFRLDEQAMPQRMKTVKRNVFLVKRESNLESTISKQIARALRDVCTLS